MGNTTHLRVAMEGAAENLKIVVENILDEVEKHPHLKNHYGKIQKYLYNKRLDLLVRFSDIIDLFLNPHDSIEVYLEDFLSE